jgi:DNA-directed RNA polymerase subunit M/transcription elongation factor TFIIS
MFCTTCGGMLRTKKTLYGKWMACPEGHPQKEPITESNPMVQENKNQAKNIVVGDGINHLAVFDHKCKKCGFGKAEMREIGASYSDEDNVVKMKCGKCGLVEQLEGKVK